MWRLVFYISISLTSAELLTILKNNTITCVLTEDSVYSAIYISSNNDNHPKIVVNRSLSLLNQWTNDDWDVGTPRHIPFFPVIDIRWEGFPEKKDKDLKIDSSKAFSFSVCFSDTLIVNAVADTPIQYFTLQQQTKRKRACQWKHFVVTNSTIFSVISNTTTQVKKFQSSPRSMAFPSSAIYKIHDYSFRYSYQKTNSAVSSVNLTEVANTFNLCIFFFVSVDEGCHLNVTLQLSSTEKINRYIEGFNKPTIKTWRRETMKIDTYTGTGSLIFNRGGQNTGFWAISDIHLCRPEIDVIITNASSEDSYRCNSLEEKNKYNGKIFCESPGFLGQNCTINCASIFGETNAWCQKQKICSEDYCSCAWGFKGDSCSETCEGRKFGLNCSSQLNLDNCKTYRNDTKTCIECKKGYFGMSCAKLPVVLKAPMLTNITDYSIEISLQGLKYGQNEATPTHFFFQYRKNDEEEFEGILGIIPYAPDNIAENYTLKLDPNSYGYRIRVLLTVDITMFTDKNVPELKTYKRSLNASVNSSDIELRWEKPGLDTKDFKLKYTCKKADCLQAPTTLITASETTTTLQNLKSSSKCTIKLLNANEELIDQIIVPTHENLQNAPEVSLTLDHVIATFPNCSYFINSSYSLHLSCLDAWCNNTTWTEDVNKNEETTIKKVHIIPFSKYFVQLRSNKQNFNYTITSPPTKPQPVTDLTVYSNSDTNLCLKWKPPPLDPRTGDLEKYKITYKATENQEEEFFPSICKIWKNYECACVNHPNVNHIEIRVKNVNFSELSEPTNLDISTVKKVSEPPLNLSLDFSTKPNEIVVKWEHPVYTYGMPEKFIINVNDETSEEIKDMKEYYESKFPVEPNEKYKLSISGVPDYSVAKIDFNVTVLEPVPEISQNPLVQWCNETCYLLVPNQYKSFTVLVQENSGESKTYSVKDTSKMLTVELNHYEMKFDTDYLTENSTLRISAKTMSSNSATLTTQIAILFTFIVFIL